jgi:hypothetical protein
VLERLKDAVGPAHFVVIDGVTAVDALDREDLVAALQGLDGAQMALGEANVGEATWLRDACPGALILQGSLVDLLRRAQVDQLFPIPEILRAEDLAVTVRAANTVETRSVVFRAEELRDIRRHVEIIRDAPGCPVPADRDERLAAFRKFIRTPRLRPEYESFVPEFCLERQAYSQLSDTVARRLARISGTKTERSSEGPILFEGFPGSGRTTGLHWLAVRLRQEGWLVAHLTATVEDIDLFAVEQVIRLIERRLADGGAVVVTVLLADGIGRDGARRLDERLLRAGRRTIVVATGVASSAVLDPEEVQIGASEILLGYELTASELALLSDILTNVGISASVEVLKREAGDEGFLGMLDRLDFQAHEGLVQVLRHEFDRFVPDVARSFRLRPTNMGRGMLGEAIARAFERAGRPVPEGSNETGIGPVPTMIELGEARDFLRSVFALAWLDKPAPLDLLARRFPKLFAAYEDIRIVAEKHGFLIETALDAGESPALAAINPGVARMLRGSAVGGPSSVLEELQLFANVVAWPTGKDSGGLTGWPRFIYELLRSVGPRGAFRGDFGSAQNLERLIKILTELREEKGLHSAQMLMLEAIALREWVERAVLPSAEREVPLDRSRRLLEEARDAVSQRPKSPARDYFLAFILAAYATTLRRLMEIRIERSDLPGAQDIARPALAAAQSSQALQDNWHPFDAAALIYYRLAQAWHDEEMHQPDAREHYMNAVDRLGVVFDLASELGELPSDQLERKNARQLEYLIVSDQVQLALDQALAEANHGQLSSLCYLLRREAIDPSTNRIRSREAANTAFTKLSHYPAAFEDAGSVVLLQRLWIGARLGDVSLDAGPHLVRADDHTWELLQKITQIRLRLGGDEFDPGVGFWLALALLELGNLPESRRVLQRMGASSVRTRRRHFDPLIVLSDPTGLARSFRAIIRRREERENLAIYVRDLDLEMQLARRYLEPGEAVDLTQGDIFDVNVALNYRGPMAIGTRWARRSVRPALD